MLKSQTATLLGVCASFDARTVGHADIEAWFAAVGDLDFEECREKVIQHYRTSRERIMPADLVEVDEGGIPPWEYEGGIDRPGKAAL
jgi:hypothetical protein